MSQHDLHSLVLHAVQNCNTERMAKAVCGLADGSIVFDNVRQSEHEVRGITHSGNQRYAVTLTHGRAFCGCPDSTFRHSLCKHCVALALHVLRTPAEGPREWHAGDTIDHEGQTGRIIAVSGEFISVWWDNGRKAALTRDQLAA
jgi:uncharacterized Zn finger protein